MSSVRTSPSWFAFCAPRLFLVPTLAALSCAAAPGATHAADNTFETDIRPLLETYCLDCHSTKRHKGDLDLERFDSLETVLRAPDDWEKVIEQLTLGEMPPEDEPQLERAERDRLDHWVNSALEKAALRHAGDPGPVVLRRLNNAEYTWTLRDLTGVESLDPAREFPGDSASGEGFMNVGNSLVMSPALLIKYLDAAKEVAGHAVLLPDGIEFSSGTSPRDWTDEKLAAIRAFYLRFAEPGKAVDRNLPGFKVKSNDSGVLPLKKYLKATLVERDAINAGRKSIADAADKHDLNAKYFSTLWTALNDNGTSPLLDQLRAQWRVATPDETGALVEFIDEWQKVLWRFASVGQIGKSGGSTKWQVAVEPLAETREVRLKLPAPSNGGNEVTFYLVTSGAGDGNENNFAVWENPRLVAPGRQDLPLRDLRAAVNALKIHRRNVFSSTKKNLAAAAEISGSPDSGTVARLAKKHDVAPTVLGAWLDCLGIGAGGVRIDSHMTEPMERAQDFDFVKGWVGADALSVLANSSDQHVRIPGNMKPHGVAVHPSPKLKIAVGWRSPVGATIEVEGAVQGAHPECGNGVNWALELRRGGTRQRLASGTDSGAAAVGFGPFGNIVVQPGDVLSLAIDPRDGNHSCDLTAVDLIVTDGTRVWNLAKDVSPNILAGNPHADSFGNSDVWHFYSEETNGKNSELLLPAGSLLSRWRSTAGAAEKQRLAGELETLLLDGPGGLADGSPDAELVELLSSPNGPLLRSGLLRAEHPVDSNLAGPATKEFGLDPAMFGRHPDGAKVGAANLCARAPSVIEVRVPAEFAEGCEFVATTTLHKNTGAEGSVQMRALTLNPRKTFPANGTLPMAFDSPILVSDGSAAQTRIKSAFDDFRRLFPAALCYSRIVPVDEGVTLTLFFREDEPLRRLMLNEVQAGQLDRLWDELHFVSQSPLKLVDAFEQLWQYATQDADPSAFEPLREPINQRAEAFRKRLVESQPAHLDAVIRFAERAYRHPLSNAEEKELHDLYDELRDEEISHEQAVRLTLARTLISPTFLYRTEEPPAGDKQGPVNDWELATRLSYFLWSSAPDAELRGIAVAGTLTDPDVLAAQAGRMLRDPRVRRLATEFGCAWLHIHDFESLDEKSPRHFPTFADVRGLMYEESILYFTDMFQNDVSVLTLFDSDHTFLNEPLAAHYGIPGVTGPEWRRVDGVKQYGRGGVLGMGATLAKHSGASRTSPILRGNWVAEVLLGDKLPRPPAGVPPLPEGETTQTLSVRELTEKHSSDPKCYGCHMRIDGYGFALEAYDSIGRMRSEDADGRVIDTRTKVFGGTEVDGAQGLRDYLLTQKRATVLRRFNQKLLGYALGRSVILSDNPLLTEMRQELEVNNFRFSSAVETIVRSKQFREIRGSKMLADEGHADKQKPKRE